MNDLRLFERCGARGRHGFYDALDFTPERCREEEGAVVRCTMAHHVGMSVLAAANALCDGVVRRWFLLDPAMAAFQPLLRERLPDAGAVLRRDLTRAPEKPSRMQDLRWSVQGGAEDWDERRCLLTNGSYELLLSSAGNSHAACRGRTVYGSPDLEARPGWSFSGTAGAQAPARRRRSAGSSRRAGGSGPGSGTGCSAQPRSAPRQRSRGRPAACAFRHFAAARASSRSPCGPFWPAGRTTPHTRPTGSWGSRRKRAKTPC